MPSLCIPCTSPPLELYYLLFSSALPPAPARRRTLFQLEHRSSSSANQVQVTSAAHLISAGIIVQDVNKKELEWPIKESSSIVRNNRTAQSLALQVALARTWRKTPTTTARKRNHQLPWKVVLVLEMIVVVENGMLVLDLIVIVVKSLRLPWPLSASCLLLSSSLSKSKMGWIFILFVAYSLYCFLLYWVWGAFKKYSYISKSLFYKDWVKTDQNTVARSLALRLMVAQLLSQGWP